MTGGPHIYRCHAGLVEFAVPLMVDGKYMGAVMGGQCNLEGTAPELSPVLPQSTSWEKEQDLVRAWSAVHKISYEKLEASICLVQDILRNLLEEEQSRHAQEELKQKNRQLQEEKAARVNLELAIKAEEDSGKLVERLDSEHLFYMLNVISRLAFLEKAEETERTACDFAAMMRYVLENGDYNCVTLGEELEYIDYYLQIQRRRMEGRLRYEISVPEKYYSTLCPFMLLHPLVKNTVKYVSDNSREGGTVTISGREENGLLVLAICCDCVGLSGQRTGQVLELESKRQGSPLVRMDQSLKNVFGPSCGITPGERADGLPGKEMQIRLPLSGGAMER
jgi:LytS/YehU family sensor histidine kinase